MQFYPIILAAWLASPATAPVLDFALPIWVNDSSMQMEDAYKWIYQATQGAEHAVAPEADIRKRLQQEWETLDTAPPQEPLIQPLDGEFRIVRLNLRPYRDRGGDMELLLSTFIQDMAQVDGNAPQFRACWRQFGKRLASSPLPQLTYLQWKELDRQMAKQGYPAIHHSEAYRQEKHPAYRVLTGSSAEKLMMNLNKK